MASNRTKIFVALCIWFAVCGLAWRTYTVIFPHFGLTRRVSQQRGGFNRQEWENRRKEIEAFRQKPVPTSIVIKVKRASASMRYEQSEDSYQNNGYYMVCYSASVSSVYARLKGLENWTVTQAPQDDSRWNVWIRAPQSMKDKVADVFLAYMHWQVKKRSKPLDGLHFAALAEGQMPLPVPEQQDPKQNRGGMTFPDSPLVSIGSFLRYQLRCPVQVDRDIMMKRLPDQQKQLRMPSSRSKEEIGRYIAAMYGVSYKVEPVEAEVFLIYHPKYATDSEIRRWERESVDDL
jgi:hypothetical protein